MSIVYCATVARRLDCDGYVPLLAQVGGEHHLLNPRPSVGDLVYRGDSSACRGPYSDLHWLLWFREEVLWQRTFEVSAVRES